jgi:hypothetical protein
MRPHDFTRYLPPLAYNKFGVQGPLIFRNVSARVFPLRANLDTLQQLCNSYLNIVPPEAGYFRVPLPYVNLVVLDYGQIGEKEMRAGWFSQVEVYFGMALEWYKFDRGQWVFHDWAVITPYIFVSDSVSVPTGRCVYGFPKILSTVELTDSQWVKNPIAPTTLARISTMVFPKTYTGGNLEERVFLEIERAALTNWRLPFDPTSPNMPWMIASNLAEALGGFGRDAIWLSQAMRICPLGPFASPGFIPKMASRLKPSFDPGGAGFLLNSVNLKQFRREDDPSKVCYRSLTSGPMQTTSVNGAGLLGESHIFVGDLTGAHTIRLHEHATLPIAQVLGLEVNRSWTDQGVQVSEFKPVLPFWIDVDLTYQAGKNIAWQKQDGIWRDGAGAPFCAPADSAYNNTVSTSIEAIAGPFRFTGTTIRVIPLLAEIKKLRGFLDEYINDALHGPILRPDGTAEPYEFRFELWTRCPQAIDTGAPLKGDFTSVFLTASSFKDVFSKTNNVGDWAKFELAFMIPVRWQRKPKAGGAWVTIGVGLVPAFTMADNCITAFSRLEIQGIPAITAQFVRPESVWLSEKGAAHPKQTFLQVNVELLAALGEGQTATFQPVVQISADDPEYGLSKASDAATRWAKILLQELAMKKAAKQQYFEELKLARALSLELLGNQVPFSLYTLKQFPDVADANKACYQSLVRIGRTLTDVSGVEEIEETLSVRLYGYPRLDIVKELGIQASRMDEKAAGIVYCIQGLRPHYIRATVDEQLGECLMSRSGLSPWTFFPIAYQTMLSEERNATKITADRRAETLQDRIDPSRTTATMDECSQRWKTHKVPSWDVITVPDARRALDRMDPQIVIESILSREWSNTSPLARWRKGKQKLLEGFAALPQDGATKRYAEKELYRQINNKMAASPGAVAGFVSMEYMLQQGDNYFWLDPALFRAIRAAIIAGELSPFIEKFLMHREGVWEWFFQWAGLPCEDALPKVDEKWRELVKINLEGDGADFRWRKAVKEIILSQEEFTMGREKMEKCIDDLSPVSILGIQGLRDAYDKINQDMPDGQKLHVPTPDELIGMGCDLLDDMQRILDLPIAGEPSTCNNLDPVALARQERLKEMLKRLREEITDETNPQDTPETKLCRVMAHATEGGELVRLARARCELQFEALVNKLSRAFQKPDFCLRRDAFSPADRDRLLSNALEWDGDWYYGENIELNPCIADKIVTGVPGCGEKQHPDLVRHRVKPEPGCDET